LESFFVVIVTENGKAMAVQVKDLNFLDETSLQTFAELVKFNQPAQTLVALDVSALTFFPSHDKQETLSGGIELKASLLGSVFLDAAGLSFFASSGQETLSEGIELRGSHIKDVLLNVADLLLSSPPSKPHSLFLVKKPSLDAEVDVVWFLGTRKEEVFFKDRYVLGEEEGVLTFRDEYDLAKSSDAAAQKKLSVFSSFSLAETNLTQERVFWYFKAAFAAQLCLAGAFEDAESQSVRMALLRFSIPALTREEFVALAKELGSSLAFFGSFYSNEKAASLEEVFDASRFRFLEWHVVNVALQALDGSAVLSSNLAVRASRGSALLVEEVVFPGFQRSSAVFDEEAFQKKESGTFQAQSLGFPRGNLAKLLSFLAFSALKTEAHRHAITSFHAASQKALVEVLDQGRLTGSLSKALGLVEKAGNVFSAHWTVLGAWLKFISTAKAVFSDWTAQRRCDPAFHLLSASWLFFELAKTVPAQTKARIASSAKYLSLTSPLSSSKKFCQAATLLVEYKKAPGVVTELSFAHLLLDLTLLKRMCKYVWLGFERDCDQPLRGYKRARVFVERPPSKAAVLLDGGRKGAFFVRFARFFVPSAASAFRIVLKGKNREVAFRTRIVFLEKEPSWVLPKRPPKSFPIIPLTRLEGER